MLFLVVPCRVKADAFSINFILDPIIKFFVVAIVSCRQSFESRSRVDWLWWRRRHRCFLLVSHRIFIVRRASRTDGTLKLFANRLVPPFVNIIHAQTENRLLTYVFSLPLNAVLPEVPQGYGSPDFPHTNASTALAQAPSACTTAYPPVVAKTELDPSSYAAAGYNQWSNGYNNTYPQYGPCPSQPQYGHVAAPAMLLYPQVYSTVNQNQIHLHLHGASTEKLEQYLGPDSSLMLSNLTSTSRSSTGGVEVGIGTDNQLALMNEAEQNDGEYKESREDPNNVWRPY